MRGKEPHPRPASTVVLLRPGEAAPEVFMVKRHQRVSFGSTFAFPGGVLEDADARVHASCSGLSAATANRLLQLDDGALDYFSAAIRELFEESGVLLAEHRLTAIELDRQRTALNAGDLDWGRFVTQNAVTLQYGRLHYFSFWITPVGLPKRYSARFFLAEAPAGQEAKHDGGEITDSCWMPAADVLKARKSKLMKLPYVTRKTLKRVAGFDDIPALLDWARACGEKGVVCGQPAFAPEDVA